MRSLRANQSFIGTSRRMNSGSVEQPNENENTRRSMIALDYKARAARDVGGPVAVGSSAVIGDGIAATT
jgi:hypothetical protein